MLTACTDPPDLIGRTIVGVVRAGDELRELLLDDGSRVWFNWRVGSSPDRVGVRVNRRPGRRWRDRDDDLYGS